MSAWEVAVIAALAMVATDVMGVVMVLAESHNRGWLAGVMDSLQWIVGITTTTISVSAFTGHDLPKKLIVGGLVTMANLFGTKLGAVIGHRYVTGTSTLADRVAALERSIQNKGHL